MGFVWMYVLVGALGGGLSYVIISVQSRGMDPLVWIQCFGMGALGGLVPALLRSMSRGYIPILQSWLMLVACIFAMPLLNNESLFWRAMIYGFISHLLWEAHRKKLRKI